MKTPEEIRAIIQASYPRLPIQRIEFLGEGWDSAAYVIDGDYVFRFSKTVEALGNLKKECALLPMLQPRIQEISIPRFEFVRIYEEHPDQSFVGYKRICGDSLWPDVLRSLPEAKRERIALQLVHFYRQIHTFPIEKALECGVEGDDF